MKASELVAIWNQNGANPSSNNYLKECLKYEDRETGTTPEHIMLSERYERENLPFTPPPTTCTSCHDFGDAGTADWVYGHRPNWWVCDQCKTVLPCRCDYPDKDGFCKQCGRMMSEEAILKYKEENCLAIPPASFIPPALHTRSAHYWDAVKEGDADEDE